MKMLARGLDYYCPCCNKELYACSVHDIFISGGFCMGCGAELEPGDGIEWTTLEGKSLYSWELTQQHISNIIYLLNTRHNKQGVVDILTKELASRGQEVLTYVPYYPPEVEERIYK